jgi:hypothetical protein
MNRSTPGFSDRHPSLEERLREGAPRFAPEPPPGLRARILAGVRTAPQSTSAPLALPRQDRSGTLVAAAAALFVLACAWWLTRRPEQPAARPASLVALSRELLGAGARVLALPEEAEGNLRDEAARLLEDSTRVAAGVVRGLPAPLRSRLERM